MRNYDSTARWESNRSDLHKPIHLLGVSAYAIRAGGHKTLAVAAGRIWERAVIHFQKQVPTRFYALTGFDFVCERGVVPVGLVTTIPCSFPPLVLPGTPQPHRGPW